MNGAFAVRTTPRFDRLAKSLVRKHSDISGVLFEAISILESDPYNHTRRHQIRKL